jgi:hypothetical protein
MGRDKLAWAVIAALSVTTHFFRAAGLFGELLVQPSG